METTMTSSPLPRKPRVHISGSEALVWDVDDVRYLRQTLRITGSLAGSLPRSPMQNIFQGLPLRLMPEELFALEAKDLVVIVDETRSYNAHTETEPSEIGSGDKPRAPTDQVTVRTRSEGLPWYDPQPVISSTTPSTSSQTPTVRHSSENGLRSHVFMNLWDEQKYFVAPGLKFGGDFLLYKQDPLICHASFVASVKNMDESLSLTDLATSARLATTVQKKHLLCSSSPASQNHSVFSSQESEKSTPNAGPESNPALANDIKVFAVEWAGF